MIVLPQQIKGGRIAEEVRDVDEEVLGKQLALAGILTQDLQIARAALDARHRHASLDPALQRALLVEREIMRGLRGQQIDDACERFLDGVGDRTSVAPRLDVCLTAVADERLRDLCHRQHEIGTPAHDGAAGHAIESGLLRVLHDDETALLFHRLQSETAVGAGPREDRADGALTAFFGQRAQEEVEGHARAMALQGLGEPEGAVPRLPNRRPEE